MDKTVARLKRHLPLLLGGIFLSNNNDLQHFDKPFKTYDEQIDLLISRNLIINNRKVASHFLSTYSYYDLVNGNINYFLKSSNPIIFKDNTTIHDLVELKLIEDVYKEIIFNQLLRLEKYFKTQISYAISKHFGVDSSDTGYLNPTMDTY